MHEALVIGFTIAVLAAAAIGFLVGHALGVGEARRILDRVHANMRAGR